MRAVSPISARFAHGLYRTPIELVRVLMHICVGNHVGNREQALRTLLVVAADGTLRDIYASSNVQLRDMQDAHAAHSTNMQRAACHIGMYNRQHAA